MFLLLTKLNFNRRVVKKIKNYFAKTMDYKRICYIETVQTAHTARTVKSMVKYRSTADVNHGRQLMCNQILEATNETAP